MSSSVDTFLQRATAYLEEARDTSQEASARYEALDASRTALLDARRARAPSQSLLPIFKALLETAAVDSDYNVRMVVPQIIEDLCSRDLRSFVSHATSFLLRALHDDNVLVAKRAVRALTTLFRRLIGFVVNVGVGQAFPEGRLSAWLQMETKAMSLIASYDEGLRKAAAKFAETVVLAFSYSGGAASSEHFTLEYIVKRGSDSPLLDCEKLEQEGVQCVKAITQLVHQALDGMLFTEKPDQSPPDHFLPPASFMTVITVLSNLVRRRPKIVKFTLPPLLAVVAAITGARRQPSRAFLALSQGQQLSIVTVLKLSLLALRGFSHTRDERINNDIGLATNDLLEYERRQEARRKERAAAITAIPSPQHRSQKPEPVISTGPPPPRRINSARSTPDRPDAPHHQIQPGVANMHKRPRVADVSAMLGERYSANEAFVLSQTLVRSMPPQEVVNFIMTRLLLNIPSAESVPGATETARRANKRMAANAASEESSQKKPKRSRFGTKDATDAQRIASTSAPVSVKKVAIRKLAPPVTALNMSNAATDRLSAICCRRILERETEARVSGALPLRIQLLSRILTAFVRKQSTVLNEFCDEACVYVIDNSDRTVPLIHAWLHSLAVDEGFSKTEQKKEAKEVESLDKKSEVDSMDVASEMTEELVEDDFGDEEMVGEGYVRVMMKLLELMRKKDGIPGELFGTVISEAPIVPDQVIKLVCDMCKDPQSIKTGLQTMCTIVMERFGQDRAKCLSLLLDLTCDDDDAVRGPAIRLIANKMYTEGEGDVTRLIEDRAVETLETCVSEVSAEASAANLTKLERVAPLITALCGQKHALLRNLGEAFVKLPREGKDVVISRAEDLAAQVGANSETLLQLVAGTLLPTTVVQDNSAKEEKEKEKEKDKEARKSDGAEELALHVLQEIIRKLGQTSSVVVEVGMQRFRICGNVEFVLMVLGGLSREDIVKHLGEVVEYMERNHKPGEGDGMLDEHEEDEPKRNVVNGPFKEVISKVTSGRQAAMNATDLLMELHKLKASYAVSMAIRACFEHKAMFKQEAVAQAVQNLIEMKTIPDMFMRTVILARLFHPELEGYLTDTVMPRLIVGKIWANKVLWDGFLRYCSDVKEISSVKLLLSLPLHQFEDALQQKESFVSMFRGVVSNPRSARKIPTKFRKVITATLNKS